MSMNIQVENGAYRIRLSGDRRRFIARNGDELVTAVRHHYMLGHDHDDNCPICRAVRAQSGKRRHPSAGVARRRIAGKG